MIKKLEVPIDKVLELLPWKTSLVYVDYTESLDEQPKLLQRCIHAGNMDAIYEESNDWYYDSELESVNSYKKELKKDICKKYSCSEEEADAFLEDYEDEIREAIYERCNDDTVKDLLRNTSKPICHYDTGYSIDTETWNFTEAQVRLERIKIKKHLGITSSKFDSALDMMIMQCNGGQLLIYFKADIEDFCKNESEELIKSICFSDAYIGIVDHAQGGGDVMDVCLKGENILLPFKKENVFLEKSIDYNWTYSIAGMSHDWCDDTKYTLGFIEVGEIEESKTNEFLKKEEKLDAIFKAGGCTAGDMKYTRHRNIHYINNYPCGNKCMDCGTFFID